MKKILLSFLVMSALTLSLVPGVFAVNEGFGMNFSIVTEDFAPIVWFCDSRVVYDDGTEPGRVSQNGEELIERLENYAFEGEQIAWTVLVMDKNGIDKVVDVYATVDGYIEANCKRVGGSQIDSACNARILEEEIDEWNSDLMSYYECTLTIETPESMYGPADITVEAEDYDGMIGKMVEVEHWFLNPVIKLLVDDGGGLTFGDSVMPGTSAYSNNILVGNDADDDSGVMLDMFISGTDFYDSESSGAKCGDSNVLELENFAYYATSGAYSTHDDGRKDAEGYVPIEYGIRFNDPNPFYGNNEIIQSNLGIEGYYAGNILAPGAEMSVIFRLDLPEPCNGDFDTGQIFFWGEAI